MSNQENVDLLKVKVLNAEKSSYLTVISLDYTHALMCKQLIF